MSTAPTARTDGQAPWPKATNYAESMRLLAAYRDMIDDPHWDATDPEKLVRMTALLGLAHVHSNLAVADELREAGESARQIGLAGLSPAARREVLGQ